MATDSSKFFEKRQGAEFVKHAILSGYLKPYAMKVGRNADRAVFVDGYSGPGVYDDDEPGSPEIAIRVSESVAAHRQGPLHRAEEEVRRAAARAPR